MPGTCNKVLITLLYPVLIDELKTQLIVAMSGCDMYPRSSIIADSNIFGQLLECFTTVIQYEFVIKCNI